MRIMKAGSGPYSTGQIADYTDEILETPNTWGLIQKMGIFREKGVASRTCILDREQDSIRILPERAWGSSATRSIITASNSLPLLLAHIPHADYLTPEDVQDRRRPGSTEADTAARVRAKKLMNMSMSQGLTLEYLMMGAIKGTIVGGSGNTIYNLFTQFGISQEVQSFDLDVGATVVNNKLRTLKRYIETHVLNGMMLAGVGIIASPTFFDAYVEHDSIIEAYTNFQAVNQALNLQPGRDDLRQVGFKHQGVVCWEYNASGRILGDNADTAFIEADTAYAFPLGVPDMFDVCFGPAARFDYVNTEGVRLYAFEYIDPEGQFIKIDTEQNPLPICRRPQALVKITATSGT